MRIELAGSFERLGNVMIYDMQKVYGMDAGSESDVIGNEDMFVIKRVTQEKLWETEKRFAIIIPVKNERLRLIESIIYGLPHNVLPIIVSNSDTVSPNRFQMECDTVETFCQYAKREYIIVHQKNPELAEMFNTIGYHTLLGPDGLIKSGKAEGMVAGTLLAALLRKDFIGFIDADNFFPGAIFEYARIYSAVMSAAKSEYAMGRILWHSKPKVQEAKIFFSKWGRVSRITNRYLNQLIASYTGFETDVIKTGNSGEHCMSMKLALELSYASGFSVEAYHFVNMFEQFGGVLDKPSRVSQPVSVYQVESRNPHLHESKGDDHIEDMVYASLKVIQDSAVTLQSLREEIGEKLKKLSGYEELSRKQIAYYPKLADFKLSLIEKKVDVERVSNAFFQQ